MIIDLILLVLQGFINILLAPLSVINISVDFVSNISVFKQIFEVGAYLIPFNNLIPLLFIMVNLLMFKIAISLIKTIWNLIPFV